MEELWLADARVPDDATLLEQLRAAVDLRQRDAFARALDAEFPGDLLEDAVLRQPAVSELAGNVDALFVVGDELFDYAFRPGQGLGNGLRDSAFAGPGKAPNLRRVHAGDFGGPDAHSCADCHSKGGPDGAGTATQQAFLRGDGARAERADKRNPPHVLGLGPVAALAREMTAELQRVREEVVTMAMAEGRRIEQPLRAAGVSFGDIAADADGTPDVQAVRGVDDDLVVRPFGWKGHQADLRSMVEESFRIHMGILSSNLQERVAAGEISGELFGDGPWDDLDNDGVSVELDSGMITTAVAYLAQLPVPLVRPPQSPLLLEAFAEGQALFEEIGCDHCHRPRMLLHEPLLVTRPVQPSAVGAPAVTIDVAHDGPSPKVAPVDLTEQAYEVELFSDLKRHEMGEDLATTVVQDGIARSVFLTRPLWGLAETAPYLHDGRAPSVHEAVVWHGGEAAEARDAYRALSPQEQGALRVFLLSLSRLPELRVP